MWVLTLIYNGEASSRPLRRDSTVKIGRSNEYKSLEDCLHIGDLKVPKKYLTIQTGPLELHDTDKTPLHITFESICTTLVNGKVHRLPSKEADPVTERFEDDDLLLKVNANKSDRIQLRLRWVDVKILAFSKKMSYDDEVMESPLPTLVNELYEKGIDIRSTLDPLVATHYLTLVDMNDYNMKIALLRAIPVVSYAWTDAIKDEPSEVDHWLLNLDEKYLYPKSENNFVFPNSKRSILLTGFNVFVCYGTLIKHTRRLQDWLKCLGCTPTMVEVGDELEVENQIGQSDNPYVFVQDEDNKVDFLRDRSNTTEVLWKALVEVDTSNLQVFTPRVKRESQFNDLRLTQRKKRRKLEKVGDTDFFLFSQVLSTPVPEPVENAPEPVEDVPDVVEETPRPASPSLEVQATEPPVVDEERKEASRTQLPSLPQPPAEVESTTQSIEFKEDTTKRPPEDVDESEAKRPKPEPPRERRKIIPQVSLADAVLSTKKNADDAVKKELGLDETADGVSDKLDNLVIVEEVDLMVRRKATTTEITSDYRGRKNFKKFKKAGSVPKNVTRTFIQLEDHDNSIHFEELDPPPKNEVNQRLKGDFDREMSGVKGFQPQESQLFVREDSENEEADDNSFSFLTRSKASKPTTAYLDGDSDDDEVTFAFSRK